MKLVFITFLIIAALVKPASAGHSYLGLKSGGFIQSGVDSEFMTGVIAGLIQDDKGSGAFSIEGEVLFTPLSSYEERINSVSGHVAYRMPNWAYLKGLAGVQLLGISGSEASPLVRTVLGGGFGIRRGDHLVLELEYIQTVQVFYSIGVVLGYRFSN